jgi:Tol biopolymer transport system component
MQLELTRPAGRLARWLTPLLVAGGTALAACDAGDTTAPSDQGPAAVAPASTGPQSICLDCPVSTRMAYSRLVGSLRDMYTMDAKGTASSSVTISPNVDDYEPAWAPDHSHVVFTKNTVGLGGITGGLWTTDEYGYGPQLTTFYGDRGASWGKNGKIAFYSFRDTWVSSSNEIYTINDVGTGLTRLTSNTADDRNPAWSPNATRIAFASNRGDRAGSFHLFVMNPDGSGVQQLTFGPTEDEPAWSPDGSRIAYFGTSGPNPAVFVMNADGTNIKKLVVGTTQVRGGGGHTYFVGQPTWAPDGQKIGFTTDVSGHHEIFTVNLDGSDLHDSSPGGVVNQDPAWSY